MLKPCDGRTRTGMRMAIGPILFSGCLLLSLTSAATGQGTTKPKPTATTVQKPELVKDLDAAIQLIEHNDFQTFIEQYCPVDMLRKLRQQDLVERAATVMANQPKTKPQLLALLKALKEQSPAFDRSGGLATLQFDASAGNVEEIPGELNIPDTFSQKLTGLGSDLSHAIGEAVILLESGNFGTFVDSMFPASELSRVQTPEARQTLLLQLKETPDLAKSMIADLNRLKDLTPELTEKGTVATFTVSGTGARKRVMKFQKVESHWRLFDNSPKVVTELTRQVKLRPGSAITVVQMERIGGNWRFIELPMLRMGP